MAATTTSIADIAHSLKAVFKGIRMAMSVMVRIAMTLKARCSEERCQDLQPVSAKISEAKRAFILGISEFPLWSLSLQS